MVQLITKEQTISLDRRLNDNSSQMSQAIDQTPTRSKNAIRRKSLQEQIVKICYEKHTDGNEDSRHMNHYRPLFCTFTGFPAD